MSRGLRSCHQQANRRKNNLDRSAGAGRPGALLGEVSGGRLLRQGLDPVESGLEAVIQLDKITELTASLTPETAVKLQR